MSLVSIGTSPRLGIGSGQEFRDFSCHFVAKNIIATKKHKIHKNRFEIRASSFESLHGFHTRYKLPVTFTFILHLSIFLLSPCRPSSKSRTFPKNTTGRDQPPRWWLNRSQAGLCDLSLPIVHALSDADVENAIAAIACLKKV